MTALLVEVNGLPAVAFQALQTKRNRPFYVPERLTFLPGDQAHAVVDLPRVIDWSPPYRPYDLGVTGDRCLVYEKLMTEGLPEDILKYMDGHALLEVWPSLILPADIRAAWEPVVRAGLELAG